jgi:hypothetical protein
MKNLFFSNQKTILFSYISLLSLFDTRICLRQVFPLDLGPIIKSKVRRTDVVPVSQAV